MISKYSSWILNALEIVIQTNQVTINNGLIVSNHLSYVDALVISKIYPSLFITSVEIKNSIGLGWITKLAGCVFVERRNRNKLESDTSNIQDILTKGTPVVLFPEGTSTNGSEILKFRPALFQSAINAKLPVHSFHISYNHKSVAYYGDMEFLSHLFSLCRQKNVISKLIYTGMLVADVNYDRKWIAVKTYANIMHEHVSRI